MMGNIEIKGSIDTNGLRSFLTFHDGGRYHIETSPLICSPNQWTGFYMITASVVKGLKYENPDVRLHFKKVLNLAIVRGLFILFSGRKTSGL